MQTLQLETTLEKRFDDWLNRKIADGEIAADVTNDDVDRYRARYEATVTHVLNHDRDLLAQLVAVGETPAARGAIVDLLQTTDREIHVHEERNFTTINVVDATSGEALGELHYPCTDEGQDLMKRHAQQIDAAVERGGTALRDAFLKLRRESERRFRGYAFQASQTRSRKRSID
jgi:hypothetical protein